MITLLLQPTNSQAVEGDRQLVSLHHDLSILSTPQPTPTLPTPATPAILATLHLLATLQPTRLRPPPPPRSPVAQAAALPRPRPRLDPPRHRQHRHPPTSQDHRDLEDRDPRQQLPGMPSIRDPSKNVVGNCFFLL